MPATAAIDNETLDHLVTDKDEIARTLEGPFHAIYPANLFAGVRGLSSVFTDFVPPVCPRPLRASLI
jgi:hypothetical protein